MAGHEGGEARSPHRGEHETVLGLRLRTWILAACALHVVLGALLYEPILFPGGDNAGYMILGEALGGGEGYRDLHLPGTPLHTTYPPFYPAVLAVLGWFGGVQLFKVASLALTTAAVGLTGVLASRWLGGRSAVFLIGLVALNPVLLDYGHWVLSEALFVALVLACLVALDGIAVGDRPQEDVRRERRLFVLGLAAASAAFLTRTAGLPLLVAVALWPALERWPRRMSGAVLLAALTAGGWALYQQIAAPGQPGYLGQLLLVDPYAPEAGRTGVAGLFVRGMENLWQYVSSVLPGSLGLDASGRGAGPVSLVTGVLVTGLALAGWVGRARDRLGPSELFVFFYVGLIAVWPSVWTDRRFLLPVLPLLLLYAALGAGRMSTRLAGATDGGARGIGAGILAGVLALLGVVDTAGKVPDRFACQMAYSTGEPCISPAYRSFYAAARWAGENTPVDAVVSNRKPRLFFLHARRRGFVYPYTSEPELLLRELERRGADHVVLDAVSGTTARYLVPAVQENASRFEVLYREGEPATWVLRFRPSPETALRELEDRVDGRGP
jgi:hypothetical protein